MAKLVPVLWSIIEKQQSAFYAFDQMMSKGTVTAEELKKQLGLQCLELLKLLGLYGFLQITSIHKQIVCRHERSYYSATYLH
jgi:transcription initiation factor IIE alpha subunit